MKIVAFLITLMRRFKKFEVFMWNFRPQILWTAGLFCFVFRFWLFLGQSIDGKTRQKEASFPVLGFFFDVDPLLGINN